MRKYLASAAALLIVCAGATSCAQADTAASETESKPRSAPIELVEKCGRGLNPTELDGGNAVELRFPSEKMVECLRKQVGVSEATWNTSEVGDTMQGDGYTMTATAGNNLMLVIERIG